MRLAVSHADSLRGTSLYAVGAAHALLLVEPHRMEIRVHMENPPGAREHGRSVSNRYYIPLYTLSLIVVPTSFSVSMFISSVYFFILGRPMPAPKPRARTLSGAVE